jgi:MFS family permease
MSRTTRKLNLKLKSQRKETPLPRGQVVAVLAVQLVEAFQVNIIFPFVVFMIRDFGVAEREEDVGRYAGAMAASFCLAQFASSFIWGYCSDGIGRKRCIVLGTSGVFLATVIFATSRSFTQALAGRILAGLLNGNVGILKSFLAEITDSTNRGRAFSLMPLAWGLGCVFAPMAGGLLSRPAIQYPGIPWGIFETFPYLLPCCVALLLQGVTVLLVIFLMVEPENDSRSGSALFKSPSSKASLASPRSGSPLLKDPESPVQELESPVEGSVDAVPSWPPGRKADPEAPDTADTAASVTATANFQRLEDEDAAPQSFRQVILSRKCVTTMLAYGSLALIYVVFEEMFPVLAATPSSLGGLDYSSAQVGSCLSIAGITLFLTTLLVTPLLLKGLKLLTIFRWHLLLVSPIFMGFPYIHLLGSPRLINIVVPIAVSLKNFIGCNGFTACLLLNTHSVPMSHLGAMNGAAQSLAALSRGLGPGIAGLLWSMSIDPAWKPWFPFGHATVFLAIGVLCWLTWLGAWCIPSSIQHPVEEQPAPAEAAARDEDDNDKARCCFLACVPR